jgi:hypothetical protein
VPVGVVSIVGVGDVVDLDRGHLARKSDQCLFQFSTAMGDAIAKCGLTGFGGEPKTAKPVEAVHQGGAGRGGLGVKVLPEGQPNVFGGRIGCIGFDHQLQKNRGCCTAKFGVGIRGNERRPRV